MALAGQPIPVVFYAVRQGLNALTSAFASLPFSIINRTVARDEFAPPIKFASLPLPIVLKAIGQGVNPVPGLFAGLPFPGVSLAI